jgi:hypothetical protein
VTTIGGPAEALMLQLPPEEAVVASKESMYETFFTRAPGSDKLRKSAQGRLRSLLREGWHELAREEAGADAVRIRFERDGATRPLPPLRRVPEPPPRRRPGERGGPGGRGGFGPRTGGGAPRGG